MHGRADLVIGDDQRRARYAREDTQRSLFVIWANGDSFPMWPQPRFPRRAGLLVQLDHVKDSDSRDILLAQRADRGAGRPGKP